MQLKQEDSYNSLQDKKTYKIKIGDMNINMEYSETNKSFKECIYNILKYKLK